jgi:anti-sigma regulatory factor (Ser/Thr protein kinase)
MSDDDFLAPETCAIGARVREQGFHHRTLFYSGDDAFLAGTLPFIREALAAEEPVLVAVGNERIPLLKDALSDDAPRVLFTDMRVLGSNPARIIPAWRRFLDDNAADGPVRGIGEPVWFGRSDHELTECQRHELLLNVAFDRGPAWQLLCPYDVDALDDEIIMAAAESHPFIGEQGAMRISDIYAGTGGAASVFDGRLPDPMTEPTEVEFTGEELGTLRQSVAGVAFDAQLPEARVADLVLAVNEVASNSVYHGGGLGKLRMWREGETLICELRDRGRISDPLVGRIHPSLEQWSGRGLWMVNQLCDLMQIRSDAAGSIVRVHMRLT